MKIFQVPLRLYRRFAGDANGGGLPVFAMTALIIVSLFALSWWHYANIIPSGHDSQQHYTHTLRIAELLQNNPRQLIHVLRQQAARYMPLGYFVGVAVILATNFSWLSSGLSILFFWSISLIIATLLGRKMAGNSILAAAPLAILLANPVFWETGMSFNLEAPLLAGVLTVFAAIYYADRLSNPLAFCVAACALVLAAQTKMVLLLPIVPAGVILCFTKDKALRRRRSALLAIVLISSALWVIPHLSVVPDEVYFDFNNSSDENFPGRFFYFPVMLFGFRGAPVLACLAALLYVRAKDKDFSIEDLAFASFFLIPLIFYLSLDTRRPWYILAAWLSLPLWSVFSAVRLWNRKWVRRISYIVTILYAALGLFNATVVAVSAATPPRRAVLFGLRHPAPTGDYAADQAREAMTKGQCGVIHGDDKAALLLYQLFMSLNANDDNTRFNLARRLAWLDRKEQADEQWDILMKKGAHFGPKIDALNEIAKLEAAGKTKEGSFNKYFEPLLEQYAEDRERIYSLLSAKVHATLQKRDWAAALETIRRLRRVAFPEQIPGIDLDEALIHRQNGSVQKAEQMLLEILKNNEGAIYAEAALHMAGISSMRDDFASARGFIQKAVKAHCDQNSLTQTVMETALKMESSGKTNAAAELYEKTLQSLDGEAASLVFIELAKLAGRQGDFAAARKAYQEALKNTEDPSRREWVAESIREIDDAKHP